MSNYIESGATISLCGRYRYRLWRKWCSSDVFPGLDGKGDQLGNPLTCVFVMLNPSTADGGHDDPTIRRCVAFAKRLGFDRLEVVNLFAYRATNPSELLALNDADDPVGTDNRAHIDAACNTESAGMVIAAWGVHGGHLGQDRAVLGWIGRDIHALGAPTKSGAPRHPLYLPADAPLRHIKSGDQ